MNWNPIHADHAIESVQAVAFFETAIEPDIFDELVVGVRRLASAHGLTNRQEIPEPIGMSGHTGLVASPGVMINVGPPNLRRRVIFRQLLGANVAQEFSIGAESVVIATTQYRRWANFSKMTRELFETLEATAPLVTQKIKIVRLQYVDRFRSEALDADHFEVVEKNSRFMVSAIPSPAIAFHVHSGWFDLEPGGGVRILTNVNVDANDISEQISGKQMRDLGILTMCQHESLTGVLDGPLQRIEALHIYLKSLFGQVVSPQAASRVSLNMV
jgi:uncharacterized protein (TIGR04255 family)